MKFKYVLFNLIQVLNFLNIANVFAQTPEKNPSSPSILDRDFMFFTPDENGLKIPPPSVNYSVDQNSDLHVFGLYFNDTTFRPLMGPINKWIAKDEKPENGNNFILFLTVPLFTNTPSKLILLSEDDKILLERDILVEDLDQGDWFFKKLSGNLKGKLDPKKQMHILINNKEGNSLKEKILNKSLRFCIMEIQSPFYSKYCTPFYIYNSEKEELAILEAKKNPIALVNKNKTTLYGNIYFEHNKDLFLQLESRRGYVSNIYLQTPTLNLINFYEDETQNTIILAGHTNPPLNKDTLLFPKVPPNSWIEKLNWGPTMGDTKDYWTLTLPKSQKDFEIQLKGLGGGIFTYILDFSKLPESKFRIKLESPLHNTYSDKLEIQGKILKDIPFSVEPPNKIAVEVLPTGEKNSQEYSNFLWQVALPQQGVGYSNKISFLAKGQNLIASYSVNRGFSSESSLRTMGVMTSKSELLLFTELAYQQWFEDIPLSLSSFWTKQRWGLAAKYFWPLYRPKNQDPALTAPKISLATLDLKFRFTPGVWEQEETLGVIGGIENISVDERSGLLGGVGFFWGRSFPKVFDDIANWFPLLRYPKWVDMELLIYPLPLQQSLRLGSNFTYSLNFHGKIRFTKSIFGEAGFGIKQFDYTLNDYNVSLQTFYGTLGAGISF